MNNSNVNWIGQIPDDWQTKTVRECLVERVDKNKDLSEKTILSLSAKEGVTLYNGENHSGNKPKEDLSGYKIVKINDIVANSMNILSGSVGLSDYNGVVSPVYYIYYNRKKENDIRFFSYIFQCQEFQKNLRRLGKGILIKETEDGKLNTIRTKVPSKLLSLENIPYPSPEKQKKIVEFLDKKCSEVDRLIELENQQIEKLKEYKQAVITEAVTKGLDKNTKMKESGVDWIGKIPEHWNIQRLKFISKYNNTSLSEKENPNITIRYVDISSVSLNDGITEIQDFKFGDAPSRARRITQKGDIIVSTVRTYLKAIASIQEDGLVASTGFCVIRPNKKEDQKFIEYFCKSSIFTDNVSANSYGISYPAINSTSLMDMHIPYPNIKEMNAIVEFIDTHCLEISELINIKAKKIEKFQEYKKSIIYEYITGKKEIV